VNKKLISACFVAASLLAPVLVQAADGDADRSKPTAFVKDSIITTKVKTKLAADTMRSLVHVRVDTDRSGMVVLSGTTKTQESADRAATIARDTEGVTSVTNHITLKKDD
jgi:hyperosmotically inducible protein